MGRVAHNKLTQEQVIKEFVKLHGDKYGYDNVVYVNTNSKVDVELICKKHGSFKKRPCELVKGSGCEKCRKDKSKHKPNKFFSGFSECYKLNLPIEEIKK